jgi:hypothetical protein
MDRSELLEKIVAAKSDIAEAERALDTMIRAISVQERAEKTTISPDLDGAFQTLRGALARLLALEALFTKVSST